MKEIMAAASNEELEAEEKVDGQNLFLSIYPRRKGKGHEIKETLNKVDWMLPD